MRNLASLVFVTLLAPAAFAQGTPAAPAPARAPRPATPSTNLPPIDLTLIAEKCKPIAKQAGVANLGQALTARISLASCLAEANTAKLELLDCAESVRELETAVTPSFELLDGVIAAGDPAQAILAEHAKGELYTSLAVRMLATIPPASADQASVALRETRKEVLDAYLEPFRTKALASFERVIELAKANPKLGKHQRVQAALKASRQHVAQKVATAS
jgi:hypothetical protein